MTASLALASAARVPVSSWGGQGVVPSSGDEIVSFEGETCRGDEIIHHGGGGGVFRVDSVVDDSDEEMEPFDAERFVDRLVEDDPPSWRIAGAAGGGGVWEAAKASTSGSSAAKLFLQQPMYHWPPQQQQPQQQQQQQQPSLLCGGPEYGSSQGVPMVVPHDPILDALFTPCRAVASANMVPTVTFGLVRRDGRGAGGAGGGKNGIPGFEPVPIYNIPPPAEPHPSSLQVPMAPLRQPSGGRCGAGRYSPGRSTATFTIQSAIQAATYLNENSNNFPGEFGAGAGTDAAGAAAACATAAVPLTGADAHSSQEYDDERHAFLRKQEMAVLVGPRYLSEGVLTPAERAAAVDWLSGLHAAAPAASGGGEPLSIETLFLAVNLMDRFLSTAEGARTVCDGSTAIGCGGGGEGGGMPGPGLKRAAAACLALASKYQDTQAASLWGVAVASVSSTLPHPPSSALNHHLGGGGVDGGGVSGAVGVGDVFGVLGAGDGDVRAARKELAAMEMRVASALGFRLTVPSAISFLGVFLRRAGALGYLPAEGGGPGSSSERIRQEAQQILLCVLRDASSLEHPPSALAAAALYWSSCITAPATPPPSSFAFMAVTGYELGQLCRCLRDMEVVRTGGGGRRYDSSGVGGGGGGGGGGGESLFGGAAFPEHAGQSLFGAGGGHPAIAAL